MNINNPVAKNFITQIIEEEIASEKIEKVITRFPPEPNGYLHIGHAKSICLNFGIAKDYDGLCSLRFDDTNPQAEEIEFIESIKKDVKWLGFDWGDRLYFASSYFQQLYDYGLELIAKGLAYVDSLDSDQIRQYRGTLTSPGKNSPFRERSIEENRSFFIQMKEGKFKEAEHVLRAKIDMSHANLNLRDPILYRISYAHHPMTKKTWCIYPLYDFAHGQSDAIEAVTHSLCSLEFEDHRPLYDWFLDNLTVPARPRQIEFSRLNLEYTVLSKRKLTQLVDANLVQGWDDPRMPTISGLRKRGYTAKSIVNFCDRIGVTKSENIIEMTVLENSIREDLENTAARAFAILNPVKIIIDNYPEDHVEYFDAPNHPNIQEMGTRKLAFSRELFIEHDDFMETPLKKFFRLAPGTEVRLKYAYYVTCTHVVKDDQGQISAIHCRYDPQSKGGGTPDERKVKGTIHWLSAHDAVDAQINEYDRLFSEANPTAAKDQSFLDFFNDSSLKINTDAKVEPSLAEAARESRLQFERLGYFYKDIANTNEEKPHFNKIVSLRDTWRKLKK